MSQGKLGKSAGPGVIYATTALEDPAHRIAAARDTTSWRSGSLTVTSHGNWTVGRLGDVDLDEAGGVTSILVRCAGTPDVAMLTQDVLKRGIQAVAHLLDDHAALILDHRTVDAHISRDFMGTRPLYWGQSDKTFAVSSEPLAVSILLGNQPAEDQATSDRYIIRQRPPIDATFYKGVRSVPPDSIITLGDMIVSRSRKFIPAPRPNDDDSALDNARIALDAAVRRRMQDSQSVMCHLSAGVDSGVVAASACSQGRPACLITHRVEGGSYDETMPAAELAALHRVPHNIVRVQPEDVVSRVIEDIRLYGPTHPTMWFSGATLEYAGNLGADRLLTGYLGDEWLTMAGGPLAQSVWDGDLRRVPAFAQERKVNDEGSWFDLTVILARLLASRIIKQRRYAPHVRNTFVGDSFVQRTITSLERAGAKHGISVEFPFADRSYVSTILGMSAWQRNRPGRPKRILRDAFSDVLPACYVEDPIKANFYEIPSLAFNGAVSESNAWSKIREIWLDEWRQDLASVKVL